MSLPDDAAAAIRYTELWKPRAIRPLRMPMTNALPELRIARDLPTLRDLTTDKLREAIMTQRFKPGQHLVERDLCEQTGVSRSSVREALRHLEAEGLVERRGNRGLFVASITADEARQIYEVRAAIEP